MNGTSMSSPNAAGAIGNIKIVQILIILKLFQLISGVYIRELTEVTGPQEYNVHICPKFIELSDNIALIGFERHMLLRCTAPWVTVPETFVAVAQDRSFFMRVDPTKIDSGTAQYTESLGPNGSEWVNIFPVRGGRTVELCLARNWTRGASTKVRMEVRFHGINRASVCNLVHGALSSPIRVTAAPFRPVDISPSISFKFTVFLLHTRLMFARLVIYAWNFLVLHSTSMNHHLIVFFSSSFLPQRNISLHLAVFLIGLIYMNNSSIYKFLKVVFHSILLYRIPKNLPINGGSYLLGDLTLFTDSDDLKLADKSEMSDALRDVQISWLEKLKDPVVANHLYSELILKYPTHLPLLLTKLRMLSEKKRSSTETATMNLVVEQILEICRPDEVLMYFGARQEHSEDQLTSKKEMEERKNAIIDSLVARANLVADANLQISTQDIPPVFRTGLSAVFTGKKVKLRTKEDLDKDVRENGINSHPVTALQETEVKQHVCNQLGWIHVANQIRNEILHRHRSSYRPF
uniref:Uncharacterized protein n=1 Tax=Heterorhabditis bacteriophora TaxID=37862 RepID=A0A1I7X9W2_HETBA